MITFLFWNINQKPIDNIIADLVEKHQVDVLMMAECDISSAVMLKVLNAKKSADFHFPLSNCEKVSIYTRFITDFLVPVYETERLTIRRLILPGQLEMLLAVVHFPSKLYWSKESQAFECAELAETIRRVEERVGHQRTILVGDLNMNPFEDGVVAASGLHAVMSRAIALKGMRKVQNREYPFFYNPMWGLLGDSTAGPPGTYYYDGSGHVVFFWNTFDQVLVRPDLLGAFRSRDVKVLTAYKRKRPLLQKGLPNTSIASDHLPLLFKLDL